jgi:hypothetical protein
LQPNQALQPVKNAGMPLHIPHFFVSLWAETKQKQNETRFDNDTTGMADECLRDGARCGVGIG